MCANINIYLGKLCTHMNANSFKNLRKCAATDSIAKVTENNIMSCNITSLSYYQAYQAYLAYHIIPESSYQISHQMSKLIHLTQVRQNNTMSCVITDK